jgi:hypothetical protein
MQIVRDAVWTTCLNDAVKMYRLSEPNEKCYRLADATWRLKNGYKREKEKRMQRVSQLIDKVPDQPRIAVTAKTCSAITMTGKPCHFRAVCGNFCRKHRVSDELKSQLV